MTYKALRPMRARRGPSRATINRAMTRLAIELKAEGAKVLAVNHLPVCPDCRGHGHVDHGDGPELCYRCDGQG